MIKKFILPVCLCLAAGAALPSLAQNDQSEPAPMTTVADLPDGQTEEQGDWVNSTEVNTVEESETARIIAGEETPGGHVLTKEEKAESVKENDPYGGAVTIIAMCIVVGALIVLSILFLCFGKISARLMSKRKLESQGKTAADIDGDHEHVDTADAIAAIAMALSEHFDSEHDLEDYILTMRRMKRAYSPWNSKIYNLREEPALAKNPQRPLPVNKNIK